MLNTIVYVVANIFRVFLICRFVRLFFDDEKVDKKKEWLWCGVFFVVNTIVYLGFHLAWLNMFCNILGITLLTLVYTKEWKVNFFVTTIIMVLAMVSDISSTVPFINYVEGETVNTISFILVDFLFLICQLLAEKIINVKKKQSGNYKLPLIVAPLCSIAVIWYLVYFGKIMDVDLVTVCIVLLIINFLVLHLYNRLIETMEQVYESRLLKEKLEMYTAQLGIIKQSEEKMRLLRHDMRHHLTELRILAMKEDNLGLQNYLQSMDDFVNNPNELVSSGNLEIDSLLNYMLMKAKEELKEVNIRIAIPEDVENTFDINIILGNLLENAIEAATLTSEKRLNVKISMKKGVLKIEVENSYNGILKKSAKGLLTTKAEGANHGLGLKSVESIVKKYDGAMEMVTDEMFRVNVILYV